MSLFTLKREVKSQKQEIVATSARQDAVERLLISQIKTASANSSSETYVINDLHGILDEIRKKGEAAKTGNVAERLLQDDVVSTDGSLDSSSRPNSASSTEFATRSLELIKIWESLARFVAVAERRRGAVPLPEHQMNVVDRWYGLFRDELALVRSARNSVAHYQPIELDQLEYALQAARQLELYLRDGLEEAQ